MSHKAGGIYSTRIDLPYIDVTAVSDWPLLLEYGRGPLAMLTESDKMHPEDISSVTLCHSMHTSARHRVSYTPGL